MQIQERINGVDPTTVLLVEGDSDRLFTTARIIGDEYPVLTATTGEDAVRVARRARPDVIVLNLMEQGPVNGFAVMMALRNHRETRSIPIVVVGESARSVRHDFRENLPGTYIGHATRVYLEEGAIGEQLMAELRILVGGSTVSGSIRNRNEGAALLATDGGIG